MPEEMRIGDSEREQVVERLRTAFAEGRLDQAELEDRLDATYRAKTGSELVPLTTDLPGGALPANTSERAKVSLAKDPTAWAIVGPMIGLSIVVTIIWALTTPGGYFWPVWVYLGMAVPAAGSLWAVWLARQKEANQPDDNKG